MTTAPVLMMTSSQAAVGNLTTAYKVAEFVFVPYSARKPSKKPGRAEFEVNVLV